MPILADQNAVSLTTASHLPASVPNDLPLKGLTVLVVEDSRQAAEALRLSLRRLGARMRRAATLEQARGHLRTYRPDAIIIDLGLPDGSGTTLIRQLARDSTQRPILLACSADPTGREPALAAGAWGFLEKPLPSGQALSFLLSPWFPALRRGKVAMPSASPPPDNLSLRDDLQLALDGLTAGPDITTQSYLLALLRGIARCTRDAELANQVAWAGQTGQTDALIPALQARIGPVCWR
ncbi:response regulator [Neogemmobacter tilapiae]|uniref:Response regulator n=1 Tax=Neogemmobacter tilapiae TaxID=875041 RepID=A0A918WMW5_9RHOB|nr:response regulator [Gemmobacter tilapiae]GHC65017.1 response regulator [Gemmobacter tilapiae]